MSEDLLRRKDVIEAIHNYWNKRLDTLPTKESEWGEVYADIQQVDKILEHNKILCNFINALPSADRPQGESILQDTIRRLERVIKHGVAGKDGMHPVSAEVVLNWLKGADDDTI